MFWGDWGGGFVVGVGRRLGWWRSFRVFTQGGCEGQPLEYEYFVEALLLYGTLGHSYFECCRTILGPMKKMYFFTQYSYMLYHKIIMAPFPKSNSISTTSTSAAPHSPSTTSPLSASAYPISP